MSADKNDWIVVDGVVVQGHQIASGKAPDSPYPDGSISLQIPHFAELGLDLSGFYPGTINVCIKPHHFKVADAAWCFEQVKWIAGFPAETFSFCDCRLVHANKPESSEGADSPGLKTSSGFIYYPHPETKIQHFHNDSLLEIICPLIEGIAYGDEVQLQLLRHQVILD